MFNATLTLDNFFSDEDLRPFDQIALDLDHTAIHNIPPHGRFANQLVAKIIDLSNNSVAFDVLDRKLGPLFGADKSIKYSSILLTELCLPWDIHTDLYLERTAEGYKPFYNFLIPLHDVDSRTFVFEQRSDEYNDFHKYKQQNRRLDKPIDLELWENNLSMCWEQDRHYLSVMKIMPYQRRGQLLGIDRRYFHSSDDFNTRGINSKKFVQVNVDIKQ